MLLLLTLWMLKVFFWLYILAAVMGLVVFGMLVSWAAFNEARWKIDGLDRPSIFPANSES